MTDPRDPLDRQTRFRLVAMFGYIVLLPILIVLGLYLLGYYLGFQSGIVN